MLNKNYGIKIVVRNYAAPPGLELLFIATYLGLTPQATLFASLGLIPRKNRDTYIHQKTSIQCSLGRQPQDDCGAIHPTSIQCSLGREPQENGARIRVSAL